MTPEFDTLPPSAFGAPTGTVRVRPPSATGATPGSCAPGSFTFTPGTGTFSPPPGWFALAPGCTPFTDGVRPPPGGGATFVTVAFGMGPIEPMVRKKNQYSAKPMAIVAKANRM